MNRFIILFACFLADCSSVRAKKKFLTNYEWSNVKCRALDPQPGAIYQITKGIMEGKTGPVVRFDLDTLVLQIDAYLVNVNCGDLKKEKN